MTIRRPNAFYNPHLLSREELRAGFIARQPLLELLVDDLRRGGGQHHLIVGARGTGKTTLLLRLALAVDDDPKLAKKVIALRFPEEQYNISRPSDFWLNCLDALVDSLEQRDGGDRAAKFDSEIERIDEISDEDERATRAHSLLTSWAEKHRRLLVLLVDNLDIVLDRLSEHHWALRQAFSGDQHLVLIGASSSYLGEIFDHDSAFYEFFNVHELDALDDDEARALILHLAEVTGTPEVAKTIEQDPGRIKALLDLTGGSPRTIGLLHGILAHDPTASIERDLEALLDQVTPYYKARFDDLSPQSQVIVDAVAMHWDPSTAADIHEKTHLDIGIVSAQLSRLVRQGWVERVATDDSKLLFQIKERFFNIWYLMRSSRRLRQRLFWLVASVRTLYGQEEIDRRARALMAAEPGTTNDPAQLLAFATAVADEQVRRRLEFRALEALIDTEQTQRSVLRDLLDLDGEDRHLMPVLDRATALRDIEKRVLTAKVDWASSSIAREVAAALTAAPRLSLADKQSIARTLDGVSTDIIHQLVTVLKQTQSLLSATQVHAIRRGELPSLRDLSGIDDVLQFLRYAMNEDNIGATMTLVFMSLFDDDRREIYQQLISRSGNEAHGFVFALGQLATDDWPRARVWLGTLLESANYTAPWSEPNLWKRFAQTGHCSEVAAALAEYGWSDKMRPVYEALRVADAGSEASLAHLAPEIRKPAESALKILLATDKANDEPTAARRVASGRATGRRVTGRRRRR